MTRFSPNIHFTDFFQVAPADLEKWGAFDISLVNDLPLFVDPFLLFNSKNPRYQELHKGIIRYMRFLRDVATNETLDSNLISLWFSFPEVKENWLGFSLAGNRGHGLGKDFADALFKNLRLVFKDFGEETVSQSSHIEKLTLIRSGVGRDNISDFTTNLIKGYLAEYTESFARKRIDRRLRREFALDRVEFNYETRSWVSRTYDLPCYEGNFVLLTPKNMLTKDEAWINRPELLERFQSIAVALPDATLRAQVNHYLRRVLPRDPKASQQDIHEAISRAIERFPEVLDYYVKDKENSGKKANSIAQKRVAEVQTIFVEQVRELVNNFLVPAGFYGLSGNTYDEARQRLLYMKDIIENKGGHRLFYVKGQPIEREADLHILYRMTWFASPSDVSREVNDGRGPADFKISRAAFDKSLVEFKLAKNSQLERNLEKQSPIYEAASDATQPTLKAIVYFTEAELQRVEGILGRLKLNGSPHIILIDARSDNKPSGSRA